MKRIVLVVFCLPLLLGVRCGGAQWTAVVYRGGCSEGYEYLPAMTRDWVGNAADTSITYCGESYCTTPGFRTLSPPFQEGDAVSFAYPDVALASFACCVKDETWGCIQVDPTPHEGLTYDRMFDWDGRQLTPEEIANRHGG